MSISPAFVECLLGAVSALGFLASIPSWYDREMIEASGPCRMAARILPILFAAAFAYLVYGHFFLP